MIVSSRRATQLTVAMAEISAPEQENRHGMRDFWVETHAVIVPLLLLHICAFKIKISAPSRSRSQSVLRSSLLYLRVWYSLRTTGARSLWEGKLECLQWFL
uniref:Uncharacterized protein n=1 Tax=Nelumbo nucifera TaxID=4432 RepID=A0A822YY92_NELNU|nr:TPA_asm: hypothetical protein HUJ06_008273 [Nelumbo nucifera]